MHKPIDYMQVFFRRKNFFIFPFLLAVFISVIMGFVLPKTYQSGALILIEEEKVINPLISGLAISTSVGERLRIIREQILSWDSLTELVRRLDMDKGVKSTYEYEELVKKIRNEIEVEMLGPQLVSIIYQGQDPEQVQMVTKTITDIFIRQNMESQTRETDVAVSFLEDQLGFYRRKIREDELARLREELDALLVDSTGEHPLVRDLNEKIAKLEKEMAEDSELKLPAKSTDSNDRILSYLLFQDKTNKSSELGGSAAANPLGQFVPDEGMLLDSGINQEIYGMLRRRLETARITRQLENFKEGTRFSIIDPPRLPLRPVSPDRLGLLLVGVVFGCMLGYGGVMAGEALDQSFRSVNEARTALDRPVIGAISMIITEDEFNQKRHNARFVYLLAAVFFIGLVSVVLISTFLK